MIQSGLNLTRIVYFSRLLTRVQYQPSNEIMPRYFHPNTMFQRENFEYDVNYLYQINAMFTNIRLST